jgi:ABC-type transport system substrate-binding protein
MQDGRPPGSHSSGGSYPGWDCDPGMPPPVAKFEAEPDPVKREARADKMQLRVLDQAPQLFPGQYSPPTALRANLTGMIVDRLYVFWNLQRNGSWLNAGAAVTVWLCSENRTTLSREYCQRLPC